MIKSVVLYFVICAQDTDQSIGRYVPVAIEFLTAMRDRLYHIGNSFAMQAGEIYNTVLLSTPRADAVFVHFVCFCIYCASHSIRCSDTFGWLSGRASGLLKSLTSNLQKFYFLSSL